MRHREGKWKTMGIFSYERAAGVGLEEKEIKSIAGRCYLNLVNKCDVFEVSNPFFLI